MLDLIGLQHDAYAMATQADAGITTPRGAVLFISHVEHIRSGACGSCADMRTHFSDQQFDAAVAAARRIITKEA